MFTSTNPNRANENSFHGPNELDVPFIYGDKQTLSAKNKESALELEEEARQYSVLQ